jgi:phage shock protein PspC (stress-responsive transcriptional regulator)
MNEVKRIHLGRQPFTISVEAHHELQAYLDAIKKQTGDDQDVLEEIESRMAELLTERGIHDKKVVLPKDIAFLKKQLGEPGDFKDTAEDDHATDANALGGKRFFRDTEHGLVAGVAAGLEAYVGIPAIIFRLLFVLLTFSGGLGLVVYVLLWLLVPEAKTPSDRLQMQGKPVTVDTIKQAVERADVPAATKRGANLLVRALALVARIFLGFVGVVMIFTAAVAMCALVMSIMYTLIHGGQVSGQTIFPVGASEKWLMVLAGASGVIVCLLLLAVGVALVSLRWRVPAWATAALIGLFVVTSGVGAGLAADVAPAIKDRYDALHHSQTITLQPFTQVNLKGDEADYKFRPDSRYYLEVSYIGKPGKNPLNTNVQNGALNIDTTPISSQRLCTFFCFYNSHDLHITIHAPKLEAAVIHGDRSALTIDTPLLQDSLTVTTGPGSEFTMGYANPVSTELNLSAATGNRVFQFHGLQPGSSNDVIFADEDQMVTIGRTGSLTLGIDMVCDESGPMVTLLSTPSATTMDGKPAVTINGKPVRSVNDLNAIHNGDRSTDYNCLTIAGDTPDVPAVESAPKP